MKNEVLVLSEDIKAQAQFGTGTNVGYYDVDPIQLLNEPFKVIGEAINVTDKAQTITFSMNGVKFSTVVKIASGVNSDPEMRTFGAMVSLIGIVFGGKMKDEPCDEFEPAVKLRAAYEKQDIHIPVVSWQGFLTAAKLMASRKKANLKNHTLQTIEANKSLAEKNKALLSSNKLIAARIKAW